VTVPGGYNTGSTQYGGQTQQQYSGVETTPGYHQPMQQAPAVTYRPEPETDYITARIPETPRFSMAASSYTVVLALIILGLVLLLVAKIIALAMIKVDFDDVGSYENVTVIVGVLNAVGLTLIPVALFYAAIAMDDLDPPIRSGMAIAAGIIIALTSFVSFM
jgi:hypothetical protein